MATISNNDIAQAVYLASKDKSGTQLHDVNKKVVNFLSRRRLLSKAPEILLQLGNIVNRTLGRTIVKVESVEVLNEKTKMHLVKILQKRYSTNEIVLVETLDRGLLGGIRLQINDEVIDLSIKNKIAKLEEYLITVE